MVRFLEENVKNRKFCDENLLTFSGRRGFFQVFFPFQILKVRRNANLVDLKNAYFLALVAVDTEESSRPPKFSNFNFHQPRG